MDGKGTQGIAANGCGASGDMDCGGTARTRERTDGAAGGAAAGTPPRTFVPGEGGSRTADTGRLSPPRKLVRLPAVVSGIMIPPIVFSSAGAGRISTLSANGLMFIVTYYILVIHYNINCHPPVLQANR